MIGSKLKKAIILSPILGVLLGVLVVASGTLSPRGYGSAEDTKSSHDVVPARRIPSSGKGENLILVVGDTARSEEEAQTLAAEKQRAFGQLQGFFLDKAENYQLLGAYAESGPKLQPLECGRPVATEFRGVCRKRTGTVFLSLPPALQYVNGEQIQARYSELLASSACTGGDSEICGSAIPRLIAPDGSWRAGNWILLSAFRTKVGAEQFLELLRNTGTGYLGTVRVRRVRGDGDIGLGSESAPDGSGPLNGSLPNQDQFQR